MDVTNDFPEEEEPGREIDISQLTPAQRNTLIHKLLSDEMSGLSAKLYEFGKEQEQLKEEIEKVNHNYKEQHEKYGNIHRDSASDQYMVLRWLGRQRVIPIANKMADLLRVVGICQKGSVALPYTKYIGHRREQNICITYKITNTEGFEGIGYKYHVTKVWEKIDKWLEEHGEYEAFYNCKNKKEQDAFITNLHRRYVDGKDPA